MRCGGAGRSGCSYNKLRGGAGRCGYTSATWRLGVNLQAQLLVAHVARLTTLYHHRLIPSSRRGATEGVLDGYQRFELDTAARGETTIHHV